MIFHINRMAFKSGLSEEQRRACLNAARQAGEANPAAKSYVVGPELGEEFEYSAVYVVEDLDGYWAYLTHPAHVRSEMTGESFSGQPVQADVTGMQSALDKSLTAWLGHLKAAANQVKNNERI